MVQSHPNRIPRFVQGRNAAYSAFAQGASPMAIAVMYDYANIDGNPNRGTTALITTCVISFMAAAAMFPLVVLVPKVSHLTLN